MNAIEISRCSRAVHVRTPNRIDFNIWHPLRDLCCQNSRKPLRWVIDLKHTLHIHDSGMATLLAFLSWIRGHQVLFKNANPQLKMQLRRAGLGSEMFA